MDWGDVGQEMLGGIGGTAFEAPAVARSLREKVTGNTDVDKPFTFNDPKSGVTLTGSPVEINDPNFKFVEKQDVGGKPVYIYAPAEQVQQEEQAPESVIEDVETEAKKVAKSEEDPNLALDFNAQMADFEGKPVVQATPPVINEEPPAAVGQMDLAPVNPEGTILPIPQPPKAPEPPVSDQLQLAPVNPEGVIAVPPKPVDPNAEARLAAEQPDAEAMVPNEPPPAPPVPKVKAPRAQKVDRVFYGVDEKGNAGVPKLDGGLPFKTRSEAAKAKRLQPLMKIQKVDDGWFLVDKTDKEIAAEQVKANNLNAPPSGILSAHEFIASLGGLNKKAASEIDKDAVKSNIKIGKNWLYSGKGGLSLEEAAMALKQAKYDTDEFENSVVALISASLVDPKYSLNDAEAVAERKFAEEDARRAEEDAKKEAEVSLELEEINRGALFQDYLEVEQENDNPFQSMLDAGFNEQDLNAVGFTKASPELQMEVAALMAQAEALGLNTEEILDNLAVQQQDNPNRNEYYEIAKARLTKAINAIQRSSGDAVKASVSKVTTGDEAKEIDLYHGTKSDITAEQLDKTDDLGPHFTVDKKTAEIFAEDQKTSGKILNAKGSFEKVLVLPDMAGWYPTDVAAAIDKSNGIRPNKDDQTPLQIKVWEKMQSAQTNYMNNAPSDLNIQALTTGYLAEMQKAGYEYLREYLKSQGYDAIKYTNQFEGKPADTYIVLDMSKIKNSPTQTLTSPTKEELVAKQDAIDKAASEKAKADRAAAAKEKADADRKAIADRSVQAADNFKLGRSAEDDLSGQGALFSKATAEQKSDAERVAAFKGGKVVYQNGKLALVRVTSTLGDPMYLPTKGTAYYRHSVEESGNAENMFTKKEFDELLDARSAIEMADAQAYQDAPSITFKDGIAISSGVDPRIAGLFKKWKKLFGLDVNIYLSTVDEAAANADNFNGPQRRIGTGGRGALRRGDLGVAQKMRDGSHYILLKQSDNFNQIVETLAHEMGHIHETEMFNNAPEATRQEVRDAFHTWLLAQKGKSARDFIDSLRAPASAEATSISPPNLKAKDMDNYHDYWTKFTEWYADQTARWAVSSEKPVGIVEQFFADVAATLRKFFQGMKSSGFLPNVTFKKYMDAITSKEAVEANVIEPNNIGEQVELFNIPKNKTDQLPLFAIQKVRPTAGWSSPDLGWWDTFLGGAQDKHISLKRVQQTIEKLPTVGQLKDNLNAYRLEDLAHGRVQVRTDDFLKFEFAPIVKEMNDNNVSDEQLTEYLLNRHAEEANDLIAKRNPNDKTKQDKGSSVETAVAKAYLASLPPAKKKVFESIAKKVDKIIHGTQDLLIDGGVVPRAEVYGDPKKSAAQNKQLKLGWRNMFDHYVPLRREETDYVLPASSFKEIGSYSKSRTGSQKKVTDILSNVGIAREIAIVRVEKERAKRAVYGLALTNPNPGFWMAVSPNAVKNQKVLEQELAAMGFDVADVKNIMEEPQKAYFNKNTGLVENKVNTQNRYADFVLPVKINGQDRFVFFNPNDARAAHIVTALKGMDTAKLGQFTTFVGNITRYFAAVNTQYNLVFGAWNFMRDIQGAALNLSTTPLAGKQKEVIGGTFTALKDIRAGIKEKNKGIKQSNPADGSWQDFLEHGGKVGYRDQFQKINDTSTLVARELKKLNRGNVNKAAHATLEWISSMNDVMENAVRLSSYRAALKKGLSKDQAAEIAKNITVNFNRKGSSTGTLSALYAFLNASIQGTARLAQTLDPRTKSGRRIIAGGLAIGVAQSIALMAAGFDDDEPSEFLKEKNLIIPTGWLDGGTGYVMIPMPLGFNILPNLGRLMIDGTARVMDGKGVGEQVINAMSSIVSAFNPLGGNAATLQSFAPTIADPFVAIAENKDAFGRPISKPDRALNPTPGYTRSRDPANPILQGIAEFMNYASGGTKDNKGYLSPTADDLSYIAEQVGGGVYREVSRAVKYAANTATGEETPEHKVPILGKVYGDVRSDAAVSQKFYANIKRMAEHENEIKGRRSRHESAAEYIRENPESRLWQRANTLENELTKLNKTRKELYAKDAPPERIKNIEDQKIRRMKQFNEQVKKLQ